MSLEGQVAIITGAGSGFGQAMAKRFARAGAHVIAADINGGSADAVAREIAEAGHQARPATLDVSDGDAVRELIERVHHETGRLDILVNNAGYTHPRGAMEEVEDAEFDRVFAVNVKSIFYSTKFAAPLMKAAQRGCIINIASTAAERPSGALTWYAGSKGAVLTITKSMAVAMAPFGIRVNAINPVTGETGLLTRFTGVPDTPEARDRLTASIPLGRYCKPSDVAHAAMYLASDEGAFITGHTLNVDGGYLSGFYVRT